MDNKKIIGISIQKNEWRIAEVESSGGEMRFRRAWIDSLQASEPDSFYIAMVPGSDVITRYWSFPAVAEDDLHNLVANRLEADLPIAVNEVTWGYRKIKTNENGKNEWQIFLQAVRNRRIETYCKTFSTAGMHNYVLTTEAEGIRGFYHYALGRNNKGYEILILATAEEWQIAFFTDGMPKAVRRVRVDDSLLPQTVRLIEAEIPRNALRSILWCADSSAENFRELFSQEIGIPVEPVRYGMYDGNHLATFAPSIGVGLSGCYEKEKLIRLAGKTVTPISKGNKRFQKILSHSMRWIGAAVAGVVMAIAIQVWAIGWENHKMQSSIDEMNSKPAAMAELGQKIQAVERIKKYRLNVEGIMIDICRALPNEIVISGIQLSREHKLIIRGTAKDPKAIFSFVDTLRKSSRLSNINPENIEIQKGEFTVSAEMVGAMKFTSPAERGMRWK